MKQDTTAASGTISDATASNATDTLAIAGSVIEHAVSPTRTRTRLDVETPSEDDAAFLEFINANLIGQPGAKKMLLRLHRAAKNKFRDRTRPIYKVLMPGVSHTGKTETAIVLALYYHGNPDAFIRINCANYKNKGDITRLLGASASWIGYEKPPTDEELLANKDKFDPSALLSAQNLSASRKGSKCPYTIILLDEFEKAGPEFEQFLLAIFSAAKERMGNNQEVDFSNCIFLMPCNLGMEELSQRANSIGFIKQAVNAVEELGDIVTKRYPPEVTNRFDEVCIYGKLTDENIAAVLDLAIDKVERSIGKAYGTAAFKLVVEPAARQHMLKLCLNNRGDVADLKRVVPRKLTDPVSVAVEKRVVGANDQLLVSVEDGELCFDRIGDGAVIPLDGSLLPASKKEVERNSAAIRCTREASKHLDAGNNHSAQLVLEKALELLAADPDNITKVTVHNQLGMAFYNSKLYETATVHFADAISVRLEIGESAVAPDVSTLYANLAMALKHDYKRVKAREVMEEGMRAIRIHRHTESADGIRYFCKTYLELDSTKALELVNLVLKLNEPRN